MNSDTEILYDSRPYFCVYKSGRVERFYGTEITPPSIDPLTTVSSKDILAIPATGVSVRLYLPKRPTDELHKRLPLLVYFHGGGFCIGRAFNPIFHNYLNAMAAEANVIIVSVDYRLAPEHPVPVPINDSWSALQWVASQAGGGGDGDVWLTQYADFDRVYLAGESAGATIAHHMGMRAAFEYLNCGVRISGLVLIHPYFLGEEIVKSDAIDPYMCERLRSMWWLVCPSTTGFEDQLINPLAGGAVSLSRLACKRVLVCVAGMDVLADRGRAYYEGLRGSGWGGEVDFLESDGEGHAFHLFKATSAKAMALTKAICLFTNLEN